MAAGSLLACSDKKPVDPANQPLCRITTSLAASKPLADRVLPAPFWFSLLVRGYQSTGAIGRPVRDCEGQLVAWTADQCSADAESATLDPEPLTDRDLVVSHLGEGRRLVWATTEHFANGEAAGPVALAVFDPRGVSVMAMGVLRAYPNRAQLRFETLGDGEVLVAEGEACADERDARTCVRGVRLVPFGKRRFVPLDLVDETGRCTGRSFFSLRADGASGQGARHKTYRIQSSLAFTPEALTVQEQLTVNLIPPGAASADAVTSNVSRITAERHIRYKAGRLIADGPSLYDLWARKERSQQD